MFYTSIPVVPGPKGHDLSLSRSDDIPTPPKPEPLERAGLRVKAQASTPGELKKQIQKGYGWLK